MAAPILDRLLRATRCSRCGCPDCDRDGTGELHNHVCTGGERCVETVARLRAANVRLRRLCGEAHDALRSATPSGRGGDEREGRD